MSVLQAWRRSNGESYNKHCSEEKMDCPYSRPGGGVINNRITSAVLRRSWIDCPYVLQAIAAAYDMNELSDFDKKDYPVSE